MKNKATKQDYPIVAVDAVIFTVLEDKLNVLLIKIKYGPYAGQWGVPGGKVRIGETLDAAAKRELREKTGMADVYLEQLYSFGDIKRDPRARIISVAYFALVDANKAKLKPTIKYEDISWFPVDNLRKLAYDHIQIVQYALLRLKYKLQYTNVVWSLLPDKFTLAELQKVYEIVLGHRLDKRNFRKKITLLDLIKPSGKKGGVPFRPPTLYSFKVKKAKIVEVF